jgi:hypothetical protein
MVSIIDFGVFRNVRKMARLWFIAACFGLLVSSPFLSLAWGGFPCEDVNNDGVCQDGEADITAQILAGYYSTPESIVIPANAKGLSSKGESSLFAGKNITVNAKLKGKGIMLGAGGSLTIGDKASIKGQDYVDLSAEQDVAFGAGSAVQAQKGTVVITSWDGSVSLADGAKLSAQDGVEITAVAQGVTVLSDSRLSTKGDVRIDAAGDVTVSGSRVQANGTSVQAGGSLLDFSNNMVKVSGGDGWVSLSVLGSTLDLCGTEFKNLDSANLDISASTVNCMP